MTQKWENYQQLLFSTVCGLVNFLGNIKFIEKRFNTTINKIIRISVTLENFLQVNCLIMKIFIRGTNFKTLEYKCIK